MKRSIRSRKGIVFRGRGQALVEFSMSVVVLALLLMGVIEFGMAFYAYIVVVDATDEAAAYAALYPYERDVSGSCVYPCRLDNDDDIAQRVLEATARNAIVDPANYVAITVTPDFAHRDPCSPVSVQTRYHHTFVSPLFFGAGIDIQYRASKMVVPVSGLGICTPQ